MEKLTLVKIRNPFSRTDRDIQPVPYERGKTLLDIRNENFPLVPVVVSVNGRIVPQAELAISYPIAGDQIIFSPLVQGADIWRGILMIVVAVLAIWTGQLEVFGAEGALAGWGIVASGAVMIVGGMLVNALLPPPKPNMPGVNSQAQSLAHSWNPQSTQQQGIPVAKAYGTMRMYGNISAAYLSSDGSKNYINALVGLGRGPYKNLYDFQVNDQPVANFQGVSIYARNGFLNQAATVPFDDTKIEYPLSVKVTHASPATYTTIGDSFDKLEIEIAFPGGLWMSDTSGNLFPASVAVSISVRKVGDVDWTVLTHSTSQVTIPAGGYWSLGYWSNGEYGYNTYWIEVLAGTTGQYDHVEGDIQVVSTSDGNVLCTWRWIVTSSEHIATVDNNYVTINGWTRNPFKKSFSADHLPPGRYDIKVERVSGDNSNIYISNDTYLSAVREVLYTDFTYPLLACVAVKALASDQLSGSLRFSCMAKSSYVRVWTGSQWIYDASNNPAWCCLDALTQPLIDATKKLSPKSGGGPGWFPFPFSFPWLVPASDSGTPVLADGYEYIDPDNGLSLRTLRYDGIDPSRLDIAAFKAWADWCDELVPDGNGDMEKRFQFDDIFDTSTSMWEAALQICQTGRAMLVPWQGNGWTIAVDKPGTPAQLFSVGNIGTDSFRETFMKTTDRASSVSIEFMNADKNYTRDLLTVTEPGLSGSNSARISMAGCTRASQAWRTGKYRLFCNLYLKRTIEIDVGIDAIACTIGDLVNVQHDVPQWGAGGRVVSANSNSVTLDRQVTIASGKTYTILIRLTDDSLVSRMVTNAAGTWTVLNVSSPFGSVPQQYDVYAFGETTILVKPFRVLSIKRKSDLECTVSAIEYNESVYNADSGEPALPTTNYSSAEMLPAVSDIRLDELLLARQDGTIDDVIDVHFTKPDNPYYLTAQIWYSTGSGWIHAGDTTSSLFRIPGAQANNTYTIAVVTENIVGDRMKPQNAPQASINTLGKLAPPSDVQNFSAVQNGQFVNFTWDHIPDADLWGYEIRQGAVWEGGRVITSGVSSNQFSWQAELNGTYRFWIKAIDTSGIYSVSPENVEISLTKIDENINVIISQDEITKGGGPDGTKTNLVFVNTPTPYLTMPHMLIDTDVPSWTDATAETSSYEGDITLAAEYVTISIDTLKLGDTWIRILDAFSAFDRGATDQSYPSRLDTDYPGDTDIHVTMPVSKRISLCWSNDNVTWSPWEVYLGTVQHDFRYIKIKYDVTVTSLTGVFELLNLMIKLDVPDVELIISGFTVSAGTGNDILFATYGEQFYMVPVVTATVIGGTVNKVPIVSSKTTNGFHIDLRDKADANVAGTVDIRVSGY